MQFIYRKDHSGFQAGFQAGLQAGSPGKFFAVTAFLAVLTSVLPAPLPGGPCDFLSGPDHAGVSVQKNPDSAGYEVCAGGTMPQEWLAERPGAALFAGLQLSRQESEPYGNSAMLFAGLRQGPWGFGAGLRGMTTATQPWYSDPFFVLFYSNREFFENGAYALVSAGGLFRGGLSWSAALSGAPLRVGVNLLFQTHLPFLFGPGFGRDRIFLGLAFTVPGVFALGLGYDFSRESFYAGGDLVLEKISSRLRLRVFLDMMPGVSGDAGLVLGGMMLYSFDSEFQTKPSSAPPAPRPAPPASSPSPVKWPTFQQLLSWGVSPSEALRLARSGNCNPSGGISEETRKILQKKGVRCARDAAGNNRSPSDAKNEANDQAKSDAGSENKKNQKTRWENVAGVAGESFLFISAFESEAASGGIWMDSHLFFFGRVRIRPFTSGAPGEGAKSGGKFSFQLEAGHLENTPDEGFWLSSGAYRAGFYSPPWNRPLGATLSYQNEWLKYRLDHYLSAGDFSQGYGKHLYGEARLTLHSVQVPLVWPVSWEPGFYYMTLRTKDHPEKEFALFTLRGVVDGLGVRLLGGPGYGFYGGFDWEHKNEKFRLFLRGGWHTLLVENPMAALSFEDPEALDLRVSLSSVAKPLSSLSLALDLKDPAPGPSDLFLNHPLWSFRWKMIFHEQTGFYGDLRHGDGVSEGSGEEVFSGGGGDTRLFALFGKIDGLYKEAPEFNLALYFSAAAGSPLPEEQVDITFRAGLGKKEFGIAFLWVLNRSGSLYPVDPLYFPDGLASGMMGADLFLYSDRGGAGLEGYLVVGGFRVAARMIHDPGLGTYGQFDGFLRVSYEFVF